MAAKKSDEADGSPQDPQAALTEAFKKLGDALKSLPKEKIEAAKRQAKEMAEGDLSWAEVLNWPPERIWQMAEVGYNHFKVGRYDKSEIIFKGLTIVDADNYYFHQMLGATFQRTEKFPEAVVEYSIAMEINPNDLVSLTNRGEVYFKLGITDLAMKDLDRAIALDAKGEDRWANRARMLKKQLGMIQGAKK